MDGAIIRKKPRGQASNPLSPRRGGVVQSNKVYLPQEVLLVSTRWALRQINAIR
jgi:hypothetical protein